MADFPALEPLTRRYNLGALPVTTQEYSAASVRFLHGTHPVKFTLELGYSNITQAEAGLLRDHYRSQDGPHIPFDLSVEAWAGHSSLEDIFPAFTQWRYAEAPEETHKSGGLVDVAVRLISAYG